MDLNMSRVFAYLMSEGRGFHDLAAKSENERSLIVLLTHLAPLMMMTMMMMMMMMMMI